MSAKSVTTQDIERIYGPLTFANLLKAHHPRRLKGTYLDREDPLENKSAFGIAQITPETWRALQDSKGEAKDFIFNDIRKKDLKNPNINIPMAVRWLHRKKRLAEGKLGRGATAEEIILEYKGLLKSKSDVKKKALENFKENYGKLKNI